MKNKLFLLLGISLIIWSFYSFFKNPSNLPLAGEAHSTPLIKGVMGDLVIEIADTNAERVRGLSGREFLQSGTGLLFIFEESGFHGFWMKDMKFAIDIIWLDENMQPVGIEQNISPDSYPQIFYPPIPVKYVLEVNAGESNMLEFN